MQLKKITGLKPDGQPETCLYLTDGAFNDPVSNSSLKDGLNLGSLGNGGLEKLIELSNSVYHFLLHEALENRRDSIVSSRSYGMCYLVTQMLDNWEIFSDLKVGFNELVKREQPFNLLPSLVAALLDPDTTASSELSELERKYFLPRKTHFEASAIRELLLSLSPYLPELEQQPEIDPEFKVKLMAWATSDCSPWCEFSENEALNRIAYFATRIKQTIEAQTLMTWKAINNQLFDLQAIRLEKGAKTFLLTTRITSSQFNVFFQAEIEPPPLVTCEHVEKPLELEKVYGYQECDLVDESIYEMSFSASNAM